MLTWKQAVISRAAQMLNSNEETIKLEAANHPSHSAFTNTDQSLQRAAQSLVHTLNQDRQAEVDFFKNHPELNP